MTQPTKSIAIPVDGSKNSLKSLDYLELMLGPEHDVKIMLCYILPAVPLIFENDQSLTKGERARLRSLESKNLQVGEKIIKEAKSIIVAKGFPENKIDFGETFQNLVLDLKQLLRLCHRDAWKGHRHVKQ